MLADGLTDILALSDALWEIEALSLADSEADPEALSDLDSLADSLVLGLALSEAL